MKGLDVKEKDGLVVVEGVRDFNLKHTFECGQCFRWSKEEDGSYTGVVRGKILNIKQEREQLIFRNSTREDFYEVWYDYLDLERNYDQIKTILAEKDPIMKRAIMFGEGIRLLNQEEWETLVSFIISQNRSISTIRKNVESLCERYGKYIGKYEGKDYYEFPLPEVLAEKCSDDIAECKVGYRAQYIARAACSIRDSKELYALEKSSTADAQGFLLNLFGVGPKVANCVMLFSMKKHESFPVDVWVMRVMKELYGLNNIKEIQEFAEKSFKQYGGFAQQYLFYYARENGIGKSNG